VNGWTTKWKDKEKQFRLMEIFMRASGKPIRGRAKENSFGKTEIFMKASGEIICAMAKEFL
jgi:hypothetical protein